MRRAAQKLVAIASISLVLARGACAALPRQPAPPACAPPGSRPKLKFGTGVSTGGRLAPFALLGSEYDQTLKEAYTTVSAQRLYLSLSLMGPSRELRYIAIPTDYTDSTTAEFDQKVMKQQYDLGLEIGGKERPWQRVPPGFQP